MIHASASDRQAFLDWVDQPESFPTRLTEDEASMIEGLLECGDTLPGVYCSQLPLRQGSSYAEAARDLASKYRLGRTTPTARADSVR